MRAHAELRESAGDIGLRQGVLCCTVQALDEINGQIQRYLLVQLLASIGVGIATGAAFALLGLEHAAVWGVAAAVLNMVPYIGSLVVTAGAALLGFVQFGEIQMALARLGGKPAIYQRMLSNFARDLPDMPGQLNGFLAQGDRPSAARQLHTLKGLAATLGVPGFGYGIRYDYGMFRQTIVDGRQVEVPDYWLTHGNPWEFARPEVVYRVKFGGRVVQDGERSRWIDSHDVLAMAYDTIVPGYGTDATNTLRLWSAKATEEIDLGAFNRGNYMVAVESKNHSENVSRVLYPDDSTASGRELRLHQEYFFVSARDRKSVV